MKSILAVCLTFIILGLSFSGWQPRAVGAAPQSTPPDRRVNAPNLEGVPFTPSIFWFGQVGLTSNHANVRVWYYDSQIRVAVHIIDRLLWFDPSPSETELTSWDAVSLYLNLEGNAGGAPRANAYLLQSQHGFQAAYRGNGSGWETAPLAFTAESTWRGNSPNDDIDDKGWQVEFSIPFTSLGLSTAPPEGTIWGLALAVHDRDDESGTIIPDQVWPETMGGEVPSSWGQLRFGVPGHSRPLAFQEGVTTVQQGLDGALVPDAHVGGHTTCGDGLDHWTEWGNANYAGFSQINIQNQWDVAEYPCFSRYYVTFPLDSLPENKTIISATLTMVLFGNAGGGPWGEPPDSYIQVLTVGEAWDESSITWNNGPLALENIAGTWVQPRNYDLPDTPYAWDVSRAVAEAYSNGEPLRLALYSADGEQHTGKYFWSSDSAEWGGAVRPSLRVAWGVPCDTPGIECGFLYLPIAKK